MRITNGTGYIEFNLGSYLENQPARVIAHWINVNCITSAQIIDMKDIEFGERESECTAIIIRVAELTDKLESFPILPGCEWVSVSCR